MKALLLIAVLSAAPVAAQSLPPLKPLPGTLAPPLLGPPTLNAYGPGLNSDATGRPFRYETDDGQVDELGQGRVQPDAYGPGIGMDQYGRPVRAKPWP